MSEQPLSRRQFLETSAAGAAGARWAGSQLAPATPAASSGQSLTVDPTPRYELSPYLYQQFMEPLGTTDGSVAAAWDFLHDRWRPDVVEATRELAPTLLRWGGIFTDYYRWKEGVGPRDQRPSMLNLKWGGAESNQVGTAELVDFCRRVGADLLICVNFESDGRERYMRAKESVRTAGAQEAAQWVDYCNNPDNPDRAAHGARQPYRVRLWQIGNETSYDRNGFDLDTAKRKTVQFARAMRKADPAIQLIGWGDESWLDRRGGGGGPNWTKSMAEAAGEHLQYLAFHHMFNPDDPQNPVLRDLQYRKDPDRTWAQLMDAWKIHDAKIRRIRDRLDGCGMPLAMTECHFSIPGRNRCEVLSSWAAGAAYARILNVHQRHGDALKIATCADFCGTRWQVNAVMIPVPAGRQRAFLMPAGRVMSLYRRHTGAQAVNVMKAPGDLDVVASRTGDRLFLHVVNTRRDRAQTARLAVQGAAIRSGRIFEIAAPSEAEVLASRADIIAPREKSLPDSRCWTFPPASVSAVQLDMETPAASDAAAKR